MSGPRPTITANQVYEALMARHLGGLVLGNDLSATWRSQVGKGGMDPAGRDLDAECGYPKAPTIQTYRQYFDREGPANRVVRVFPDECWAVHPEVADTDDATTDSPFESAWKELDRRVHACHFLHRGDVDCGVGRFGILLLGFSGGEDMKLPVADVDPTTGDLKRVGLPRNLLYLRSFSEDYVTVSQVETNPRSPRFGQPLYYQITFFDPASGTGPVDGGTAGTTPATANLDVHWSRVLHLADNREASETYGTPRMQAVLNRLYDLRKVLGSSGEMWWRGAFPGYQFVENPQLTDEQDRPAKEDVKDEVEAYQAGLQRFLSAVGGEWKSLAPQVADPTNTVTQHLLVVCLTLGVPLRIFQGSEAGHLASTQDSGTWNKRVASRQRNYLDPLVVLPFVDRLVCVGALPVPARPPSVWWVDLNALTDKDKADVSLKQAQALMQYVAGGCEAAMPLAHFLTTIMHYTPTEAAVVVAAVDKAKTAGTHFTDPLGVDAAARDAEASRSTALAVASAKAKTQGGGRAGNAGGTTGRPAGGGPGK